MRIGNSNFQLAELICKSISGTLTEDENEVLAVWRSQAGNDELYSRITNSDAVNDKFEVYQKLNSHAALERVKTKIAVRRKEKTNSFFRRSLKYAAAVVLLSITSYLFYQKYTASEEMTSGKDRRYAAADSASETLRLTQSSKKAVLVLANGEEVNLATQKDGLIQLPGVAITNEDNLLSYENTDGLSDEGELAYNTLKVPVGGEYQVLLPDGSRVWLNSASSLTYPVRFAGDRRMVQLQGEAYFEVKKDSRQFVVETGLVEVKVLGTEFNLSAYADDKTIATTLVEGKVSMKSTSASTEAVLTPSKQAVYDRKNKDINIRVVDTEEYTAWKDGKFYFEKAELESILVRLSRWYAISVEYEHPSLKDKVFTGMALKEKPVEHILELISKTSNVDYRIDNNKVKILKKK
ncbi:FecR family protein [uncultured Pontibacter sp.]|uniref:FecR family protein n=1 Tax=uncultured Pontibacter sp. TaxID=453356 RepID=UPI002631164D|nr:FecR domain-containing protein [uncultured Pontibacter sp.]